MRKYERPHLDWPSFRDEHGQLIDYGNRWGTSGPPENTYSRATNLERFKNLHRVAEALIGWLSAEFNVALTEGDALLDEFRSPPDTISRIVKLEPRQRDSAPIVIAFTSLPGIALRAGAMFEELYPHCGCEACDEDPEELCSELERMVLAVVHGHFSEHIQLWLDRDVGYRVADAPGEGFGASGGGDAFSRATLRAARTLLPRGGRWQPWPTIAASS